MAEYKTMIRHARVFGRLLFYGGAAGLIVCFGYHFGWWWGLAAMASVWGLVSGALILMVVKTAEKMGVTGGRYGD